MQKIRQSNLGLLAASHGMNHIYQLIPPVIMPEIARDYGFSDITAGLLLSCFYLSYALLPVVSGYFSQVFSRKYLLALGFVVSALSFLAIGLTQNVVLLGLLFFAAGAGGSTYHPNGAPLLAETYQTGRGGALGLHQTGGAIGSVAGPILTGILVLNLTWNNALVILAFPGIILAVTLWFLIGSRQSVKKKSKIQKIGLMQLKTYSSVALMLAAAFIYVLGLRGTDAFASTYFIEGRDIQNFFEASLLFASLKVSGLFSAPICGRLSDMYSRKRVLIILVIIGSASLYAITITPVALLIIPCVIFGFAAFGLLGVGEALLADITPEDQRSMVFGLNYTISFSSSIILAPALFAIAGIYNYNAGFIMLSALMPFSILILLKVKNKPPQKEK
jgi:FSR family fosmidomycin resistance protein-like MFS transporter